MARNHLIEKNFWDSRVNLKNKPSLSFRTIEVINYLMQDEEIALGTAIEKLMLTGGLYENVIEKLKGEYSDI